MRETVIDEWASVAPPPPPSLQSVMVDPARTALLLMDFLGEVCTAAKRPRAAAVMPDLAAFTAEARRRGLAIVHTTTPHGDGSELAAVIKPLPGEPVYPGKVDKFHGCDLEAYLRRRGVGTVIATGTSANGCLLFTVSGAVLRGFNAVVPIDAMPAATAYQEQFVAWQIANAPVVRERAVLTRLSAINFAVPDS